MFLSLGKAILGRQIGVFLIFFSFTPPNMLTYSHISANVSNFYTFSVKARSQRQRGGGSE